MEADREANREQIVLVLQGGGALGAYQAGVYEELSLRGHAPEWVAGISIGAINGAIIAGNKPENRVARLREFWELISSVLIAPPVVPGEDAHSAYNEVSATWGMMFGIPGFFAPRVPPALAYPRGFAQALSVYDTEPLRQTLNRLVDFDALNAPPTRLSVGAVNVATGNFAFFDTARQQLNVDHIMASGALPPGFPPIEIDGQAYWDGGLVSNTPLEYVLDEEPRPDQCIFQVDLFSARGPLPKSLMDVAEREKDIRFSSRTRLNTDEFKRVQTMRRAIYRLLERLPPELQNTADAEILHQIKCDAAVTIVHFINRRKNYFSQSKDYDFSRHSVEEHWAAGRADVAQSLSHPAWLNRKRPRTGVTVLDLTPKLAGPVGPA